MASGSSRRFGSVLGTAALLPVRTVGFRPREVRLVNLASGDELYWVEGMADDSGVKRVAAGTATIITSGGIIPLADGFSLGTDSDMNVSGELVRYAANE